LPSAGEGITEDAILHQLVELSTTEPERALISDLVGDMQAKWSAMTDAGSSVSKRLQSRS